MSADGVFLLIVTLAAKVFNVLTDILSEVDDLVEADEGEHAAMECTAESFSSFVPSKSVKDSHKSAFHISKLSLEVCLDKYVEDVDGARSEVCEVRTV